MRSKKYKILVNCKPALCVLSLSRRSSQVNQLNQLQWKCFQLKKNLQDYFPLFICSFTLLRMSCKWDHKTLHFLLFNEKKISIIYFVETALHIQILNI